MKSNFYRLGKAILSESMVIKNWWKQRYDFPQLLRAFGLGALRRGVLEAQAAREQLPMTVLELVGLPLVLHEDDVSVCSLCGKELLFEGSWAPGGF